MTSLPPLSENERVVLASFREQFKSLTSKEAMDKARDIGELIKNSSESDIQSLTRRKIAFIAYSFLLEREESEIAAALARIKAALERTRNKKS